MQDQYLHRKIVFIAMVVSLCACLQIFKDHFIYWQDHLFAEPWRLWTAHWVHVGWIHYLLNMIAFACLPFIFPRACVWHFSTIFLLISPLLSLSFYWVLPDIGAYAGLSGVLHGAYAAIACVHLLYKRERSFAALVLFLIFAKLIWENTIGSTGTAQLIGSPVLVEAHLLGVIWGILLANIYIIVDYCYDRS
ncbi:rhombosortase [Acinetobacter wanghuae]|uniref:Rhombosortase n=1 Tax=Acinetobacter wanghuae TaxID=2662362 RepID=A0A5Q0P556_9GAMM|nr:rhombosortase [Acinetobacter wanghuae]MQW92481.1 rhombosortase [Acinetobacter wanghuae]QGA11886.1 rhombosortase [Acinetobacter wanghuae]